MCSLCLIPLLRVHARSGRLITRSRSVIRLTAPWGFHRPILFLTSHRPLPPSVSQIYLDNKLVFQVAGGNIDKNLPLTPGEHRLEVKSWTKGQPFHNDFFLSTPRSIPATVPPCSESTNFAVNICSPGQKAAVDAPVHVVAAAKSTAPITTMQIYLDFKEVFHSPNSTLIETDVPMNSGSHLLVVKAWDSTGRNFSSSRNITVP